MELVVVLFIISIMFAFALPSVSRDLFRDDTDVVLNWITMNVGKLKRDAGRMDKNVYMCIRPAENIIRIRKETSQTTFSEMERMSEYTLPEDVYIEGVEFKAPVEAPERDACIRFSPQGYSDHAMIYISNSDGKEFSCLIQPFLHKVKIYDTHTAFR